MAENAGRLNTVRLQQLSWEFTRSAVLFAAIELDLFTRVSESGASVESIAGALGLGRENTERMLKALVTLDLVRRTERGFENAPDVERYLVSTRPSYAGKWIHWFHFRWQDWGRLGERLRADAPADVMGHYTGAFTEDFARRYHEATASVGMGAARWFVKNVSLAGRRRLLDLGGGSGAYSIVAAQHYPELTAVVLDMPEVVPIASRFIAEHGVSDRVTAAACNFIEDPLPGPADVILMNSNLPMYGRDEIQMVVRKAFEALEPGGEMHICGEVLRESWQGPLVPAMCGLHGALDGSTARAHTPSECLAYFKNAGFEEVSISEFVPEILMHVQGVKPAASG